LSKAQVSIGLINPKSPTNVGAVLRAAGCFRAGSIFYTGTRYDRAMRYSTDTSKGVKNISLQGVESLLDHKKIDAKIICVELVEDATPLHHFNHPDNAYYIFGPEDGSIDQKTIDQADDVVYIPTKGCMNLAATVNVVLYDRLIKSKDLVTNNEFIKKNKDINSKIKIKNL
jgi:tRNA(Leu) C34 or U34 (ribose-2'-O)-methylase TrmL